MRIGVEVSAAVSGRRTGVGHYVANLVTALQRSCAEHEFTFFSNGYDAHTASDGADIPAADVYPHDRFGPRLAWLQVGLPRSVIRTQLDVCHFPNHIGPVLADLGIPAVATVHDMSVFRYPEHHESKTVRVHRTVLPLLARRGWLIITLSAAARNDVLAYLDVPEDQVHVVHGGVDAVFHAQSEGDDLAILRVYDIEWPYILSVGTLEPRKNGIRLIDAFVELVRSEHLPHHLVLAGADGWKNDALRRHIASALPGRIHALGYVPTAHLPALYRGASLFAFPSLHEGFGLPALEALACGTPTLISTDPALLEVCGEAAIAVEPDDVDVIAAGMHRMLSDVALRTRLRNTGLRRAAPFTWDRAARQTFAVYEEAVERHGMRESV